MAQNLSLTGFDLAFVEAWKVIDVTQEQFLVIDIGDINHDVVESLDAEKRNKLLQDNLALVTATLQVYNKAERQFSVDELDACIGKKFGEAVDKEMSHRQAATLKGLASHVIREAKKTRNSRTAWMGNLKAIPCDKLVERKPGKKKADDDGVPTLEPGAGSGKHVPNPDEMETLPWPGVGGDAGPAAAPEPGEDADDDADEDADVSEGAGNKGDGEQADDDAEKGAGDEDKDPAADEEAKKEKNKRRNTSGPMWLAYQGFMKLAKEQHGISQQESQRLWKLSNVRAALIEQMPEEERKKRRFA